MKVVPKVKKFQMGGQVNAAQQQGGGEDPVMALAQMAAQALQNQDCQSAMQVCQAFVQMLQQQGGGAEGGGAAEPAQEPVYRRGGKLIKRI